MITAIKDVLQGKTPSFSTARSSHWSTVRKNHLLANSTCAVCESKDKVEVHHIKPFHLHPELELEPTNLISLCETTKHGINCHLLVGHLGNYKNVNPSVVEDAQIWNKKLATPIPVKDPVS